MTCSSGVAAVAGVPERNQAGIVVKFPASGIVVLAGNRSRPDLEDFPLIPTLAQRLELDALTYEPV